MRSGPGAQCKRYRGQRSSDTNNRAQAEIAGPKSVGQGWRPQQGSDHTVTLWGMGVDTGEDKDHIIAPGGGGKGTAGQEDPLSLKGAELRPAGSGWDLLEATRTGTLRQAGE